MNVPLRVAEEDFSSVADQMGRWVDRVLGRGFHRYRPKESWSPAVNLYEDSSAYFLAVDLAGVEPDTIDLRVEQGRLVVRGQRASPSPPTSAPCQRAEGCPLRLHLMEIDHGPFHRALDLPQAVDEDEIEACYRNGFLWVKMPKEAGSK